MDGRNSEVYFEPEPPRIQHFLKTPPPPLHYSQSILRDQLCTTIQLGVMFLD